MEINQCDVGPIRARSGRARRWLWRILVAGVLTLIACWFLAARYAEWQLHSALRNATRLHVRTGGTCHRRLAEEQTLADITDRREIFRIVASLRLRPQHPLSAIVRCMCCGNPTLEFYEGDRLAAEIGVHHGEALRWPGVWEGDADLSDASRRFLVEWLDGLGGPKPTSLRA